MKFAFTTSLKILQPIKNRSGQFVIEAVLLATLSIGLFVAGTRILRKQKVVSNLVEAPWSRVKTMVESGSWRPYNPTTIKYHPNRTHARGVTLQEYN